MKTIKDGPSSIDEYRHSEERLKMETKRRAADYDVGSNFKFKKTYLKYYSNY